jgi:hypothetical protein
MSDSHAETYIVHVVRRSGTTIATIERNDGKWYDEIFTEIATTPEFPKIGEIIKSDFNDKADSA